MNPRRDSAFTWIEALVCLAIIGILTVLVLPAVTGSMHGPGHQMTRTISNMRQLHLATQQMWLDGETIGDKTLGWPGDTGGTFSHWVKKLVPDYLTTNDLCKLLSAPGIIVKPGKIPSQMSDGALLVYAVSTNSPDHAVFLTSANFTNTLSGGLPLEKSAKPYGDKAFVVFRKGGEGKVLLPGRVGAPNVIGSYVPLCQ